MPSYKIEAASLELVAGDLLKEGLVDEAAELLSLASSSMTEKDQELQMNVFERVLSDTPVDVSTLSLDPKTKVMKFSVTGMDVLSLPKFLDKLMRRLSNYGTTDYTLEGVDRGRSLVARIKIG
tara:strand:+ start:262 stop:630 length:369 start_codon:yes stop_codon:yes gene_type:complete